MGRIDGFEEQSMGAGDWVVEMVDTHRTAWWNFYQAESGHDCP